MSYGLYPSETYYLFALAVPFILWWAKLRFVKEKHITIFHHSSLAVSFWEEILFRGIFWGLVLSLSYDSLVALTTTSLLFGMFHLRNLWWAPSRQVFINCLYTGLVFAPLLGLVRWWSGDVYLCIALHALHNFITMYGSRNTKIPTDEYLQSQRHKMNSFERFFSLFWIASLLKRTVR
jgi:membrane protease YdiL (CAAX protease family)